MTPLIGFRTKRNVDSQAILMQVRPSAITANAAPISGESVVAPSRAADYAYRIAAVTAGLVLLATVM